MSHPQENKDLQDERKAAVVSEHLPDGYNAEFDPTSEELGKNPISASELARREGESSLKLQGGDIHRDLFKINDRSRLIKRAATFSHPHTPRSPSRPGASDDVSAAEQRAPQGFRRQFVRENLKRSTTFVPGTKSFVEFLDLYGSFAGEDLAESDSEDDAPVEDEERRDQPSETRPLLGRRKSSKRVSKQGDAGMTKSFFTLLKAFIGTGIMFLPKAFNNGGILFSSMTLLLVSAVSTLAFHLLLQCRSRYGGGYGELAGSICGPKMRALVLGSIALSQLGFVCAGIVFVAQNMFSFFNAVLSGPNPLNSNALIALQLVVLIPLAFIRNISKLGPAALLADVCILLGLMYIYYYDIASIAKEGLNDTVELFNPNHYALTIGSAIFTFEGIGLILPIQSSMRKPEKFEPLLVVVMLIVTVIYTSVGVLCYATFGSDTQIEIISNYPQDSKLVNAMQFLYSLAVLVGNPVQLFPAIRILEGKFFGHLSGKRDAATKWKKNAFRGFLVCLCGVISILGASNLDRFVALIGSFACVPLVYIYPPWLHYKGVAESRLAKFGDIFLMGCGIVAMIATTAITIINSFVQA